MVLAEDLLRKERHSLIAAGGPMKFKWMLLAVLCPFARALLVGWAAAQSPPSAGSLAAAAAARIPAKAPQSWLGTGSPPDVPDELREMLALSGMVLKVHQDLQ